MENVLFLTLFLTSAKDWQFLTSLGKLFHNVGPTYEKALLPVKIKFTLGNTLNRDLLAERSELTGL